MRRVLEAFTTFEYQKGIAGISTSNIIAIIKKQYVKYFSHFMFRLVLNTESHYEDRINNTTISDFISTCSEEEKIRTAKSLICLMFLLNKLHILCYLGVDAESKIEEWLKDCEEEIELNENVSIPAN